ncbi:MAG: carboxypeptidase-like regulatory domain-containing protein, partial [Salegentibacter sp.]
MKNIFTMALLLCTLTIIAQSKIQVLDKSTGEPVVNAAVKVIGANKWTSTDIDGYFSLEVGSATEVEISHLNYKPVRIKNIGTKAVIYLEQKEFLMDEVIVRGNPLFDPTQSYVKSDYSEKVVQPKNVGELFSDINGFGIIKRGSYSVDPSFRASQYEQLNVQFDGGSKAMHACPSRMDPVSTLLNPEEVERIEVIKGPFTVRYGSTFGGIINMVTSNASATQEKLSGAVSSGYESNGNSIVNIVQLNSKLKDLDLSGNFSHRDYGNYKDGAGNEIPSSFRSLGYGLKAGYNFDENQRLQASFRQNFGRDILHAGLMMDTEEDNSSIAGIDYKLRVDKGSFAGIDSKIYYSYVRHLMDNYNRPSAMMTRAFSDVEAATYGGK